MKKGETNCFSFFFTLAKASFLSTEKNLITTFTIKQMNIYFSHGKKHGPTDPKILQLKEIAEKLNFNPIIIDATYTTLPDKRVADLIEITKQEKENDFILVGSSMGGYVSLIVSERIKPKGIFLLAPALYINGYQQQKFKQLDVKDFTIIHGWNDKIVPIENSIKYSTSKKCNLHLIPTNHTFSDSFDFLSNHFEQFLKRIAQGTK